MEEEKIAFETLVKRLGKALNYPIGMNHLAVMMHGWRKKCPKEVPNYSTLYMRKKDDGFPWLNEIETLDFSAYVGYDLTGDDEPPEDDTS